MSVGRRSTFLSVRDHGGSPPELGKKLLSMYMVIGGEMTRTASVDRLFTPVTIVREIKEAPSTEHTLARDRQPIDRDDAAV